MCSAQPINGTISLSGEMTPDITGPVNGKKKLVLVV